MSWNVMFCHGARRAAPLSARFAEAASARILHVVPPSRFVLPRSVPPPPARPCGGTLFRAYRAPARPRVGAGAVRAPDCARETADAPVPFASAGVFFRGPSHVLRRNAKGGPASRLSLLSSYYTFPICQVMMRIFPEIFGQTGNISASPAPSPGGSAPISPRAPPGRPSLPRRGRGAARRPPGCGGRASRRLRASAGRRPRR